MTGGITVPVAVRSRYLSRQVKIAAGRLVDNLETGRPGAVDRLRANPIAELRTWDELTVTVVDPGMVGGRCSVVGQYNDLVRPPTLTVARSTSDGKTRFTACHELGHHEQRGDLPWFDAALARQSDNGWRLEEQVCEAFAAEILLGDDVVAAAIGDAAPSAETVRALRAESGASREACCVRAAQLLRSTGFVMLADLDGHALFVAVNGDLIRPRRGSQQGPDSLAARAASAGTARDADTFIQYGNGRRYLHWRGDAVRDGWYVYVVLTEGRAAWQTVDVGQSPQWEPAERNCERCGDPLELIGDGRCPECGAPPCTSCGASCTCGTTSSNRTCSVCHLTWATSRFTAASTICHDCE